MTYTTQIEKDYSGKLSAKTAIELGECIDDDSGKLAQRILSVTSSKSRGGIGTIASVHILVDEGEFQVRKFTIFQDYQKTIANTPCKRVTEKTLTAAHDEAMKGIDVVLLEVKAQYNL